jgi:D-serine deaminase-like pyridoxal phosphate-dependent protein
MLITDLPTPALLLDADRVERNCARMLARASRMGVVVRPHMKTAKSARVAQLATGENARCVTVSTLAEIDYFAQAGFRDITYAVGATANKIAQIGDISRRHGAKVTLVIDSVAAVDATSGIAPVGAAPFDVLIEIDCGGGRGGVASTGDELVAIAKAIEVSPVLNLVGVLTHAGHSYGAPTVEAIADIAEAERHAAIQAADRLRKAGFEAPVVSVGSTPTAVFAKTFEGVTEIRPGVYTLFDLDQALLGTCSLDDIAASVLTTVIGHNPRSQSLIIDAGALALSKDLSAHKRDGRSHYGLVCAADGEVIDGLCVTNVHQEHGFVSGNTDYQTLTARHPIGSRLRVLPNHVCMTAAPYDSFHLVRGKGGAVIDHWSKVTGWQPASAAQ